MNVNMSHVLIAFLATLAGVLTLAIVGNQNLGGTLQVIDALTGLLLIEGGAIAGGHIPTK